LKYEHLYRLEIDDRHDLGLETETYRQLFNTIRLHQTLHGRRPLDVHLEACQTPATPSNPSPKPCHFHETGRMRVFPDVSDAIFLKC